MLDRFTASSFVALATTLCLTFADAPRANAASCGDGNVNTSEQCDDGNHVSGDGCSTNCNIESGYDCVGTHPSVCDVIRCGNGIVQAGEDCDGGVCCEDDCTFTSSGTLCRGSSGSCDLSETCTGSSSHCPADAHSTAMCRASLGGCDPAEFCSSASDECPADVRSGSSTICRAAVGGCDAPEFCSGNSTECPFDLARPAGTICRSDAGVCDLAEETCNGVGKLCPRNRFASAGTVCRASAGECDVAETCTGSSGDCPADAHRGSICRVSDGPCDAAERCGPASVDCPPDAKSSASKICRASKSPCDAAEHCDGESDTCPADEVAAATTVCRTASGSCDAVERCDGVTAVCPADQMRPGGSLCRAAVSPSCDVAETCTGTSNACPADVLVGCPDVDGVDCVHPACDASGECTTRDDCVEICRQPAFWGYHSGREHDRLNLTQMVLDQVGPLEICGQSIDSTDLGELDSAVEALCVRAHGVKRRTLFRALVTTALNCSISEGGTCDQILSRFVDVSFSECNSLCKGSPAPGGPTVEQCIDQLFCFNRGGVTFDGKCALGTCEDDPDSLCGDDFAFCPDLDGNDEDGIDRCEPFEGNCSDARLCTTGLETPAEICVQGRARPSSVQLCQRARKNVCVIGHCP